MKSALIGLGRIGWDFHLRELLAHKCFKVCAVVDSDPDRLLEAQEKFGIKGYTDYKEMLLKEKPELTIIASPTIFHEEHAINALKSGCDVILDKPMAHSFESAQRIYNAYIKSGKKLIIYQPHRFTPEAIVAKSIIESGILGEIFQIKRSCTGYSRRNDWQAFKEFGGGMLMNYGAHYIDQLLYISGEKVKDSYCITRNIATLGDADDVVKLVMQTQNNMILDIDISQASAISLPLFVIYGKYGAATLVCVDNKLQFALKYFDPAALEQKEVSRKTEAKDRAYPSENINWKFKTIDVLSEKSIDFYDLCFKYFTGQINSPITVEETMNVMKIICNNGFWVE